MNCQNIKEKFPDFLIGDIDPNDKKGIESHLAECESCRQELENLGEIWAKLGVLPDVQPNKEMRTRFYTMLDAYRQGLDHEKPEPRLQKMLAGWLERWWPQHPAFQFSLALLMLVVGLTAGYFLNSSQNSSNGLQPLRQEVNSIRQALAISLLDHQSPTERLRGITMSFRMDQPGDKLLESLLDTLNNDPNVNVRLAAVDALYLFHNDPLVKTGLSQSLITQTSPLVQVSLIDLIVNIRERQAIDALRTLIQNESIHADVKQKAEQGLEELI
jgi:hypothetical protein